MRAVLPWLGWVLVSFSATLLGVTAPPDGWYESLAKPAWTPPGWVFPVVWTTLYTLMGTAAWLVWRRSKLGDDVRGPLIFFFVQLGLNASWTPTFFGMHEIFAALLVIIALWVAILATLLAFRTRSVAAAWLLVPYLAWVSLATVLNFQIWRLQS